jgi:LPS-assembly lipoprotein
MSSSDGYFPQTRRTPRRWLGTFAIVAGLGLAGCTVQPLYGPTPTGSAVSSELSQIVIDPVYTRVAQQVRNGLIFAFGDGAGEPANPLYKLHLTVSSDETGLGVTSEDSASAYAVTVAVTYTLTRIGSDQIIARGTIRGQSTYDYNNQGFSNARAHLDAENKAAAVAVEDVRIRLAAVAATGFPPPKPAVVTTPPPAGAG